MRVATLGAFFLAFAAARAQVQSPVNFADLIRTPADIQRTLEYCDGHPAFETTLVNWLEMAEPSLPADRQAVREISLRLLEDVTNSQLVLGLGDGLLRHALEDLKRDRALVPDEVAISLYKNVQKAVRKQQFKAKSVAFPANNMAEDGTVTDERQAAFLEKFLDLAEPRVAHVVQPARRIPGHPVRARLEQSDRGPVSKR